jgi:hypothetical protein
MKRKLKIVKEAKIERQKSPSLSAKESIERIKGFNKRKEKFIASIKKSQN